MKWSALVTLMAVLTIDLLGAVEGSASLEAYETRWSPGSSGHPCTRMGRLEAP
jgi:hypothetical protein